MTDAPAVPDLLPIHPLTTAHLPGALALTRAARWNQDEADWRHMLATGEAWGISDTDGRLLASTVILPYAAGPQPGARRFAWISMVLVAPDQRRRGHASRLLRTALARLAELELLPILDATPDGREVYRREGFVDRWGFERWAATLARGGGDTDAPLPAGVRALAPADWSAITALDVEAFGGDRTALLRSLASRRPDLALVCDGPDGLRGFVLGRSGHDATQVGPLVAIDDASGKALLHAALLRLPSGRTYVDVPDARQALRETLATQGFAAQRPFTRMLHLPPGDPLDAPGRASRVMLVAGPELG